MLSLQGKLVRITSYRGEPRDRLARVVKVRDTWTEPVSRRSVHRHMIERSRYLLTVHDVERNEHRSYYHDYVTYKQQFSLWGWIKKLWEDN